MRALVVLGGFLGLLALVALLPGAAAGENVTVELRALESEGDCPHAPPCWDKTLVRVPYNATVTLRLVGPTEAPHRLHVEGAYDVKAPRAEVLEEGGSMEVTFDLTGPDQVDFVCEVHHVTMWGVVEPVHPRMASGELVLDATFRVEGATVHADASASRDSLGPLAFAWEWEWSEGVETGPTAAHTFDVSENRRASVRLTATAADGAVAILHQPFRLSAPESPTRLSVRASERCGEDRDRHCWTPDALLVYPGEHVLFEVVGEGWNARTHRLRFADPLPGAPPAPPLPPEGGVVLAFQGQVTRDMPFHCEYHPNMTGRILLGSSRAGPDGGPLPAKPTDGRAPAGDAGGVGDTGDAGNGGGRGVSLPPAWMGLAAVAALAAALGRSPLRRA